jgi:ribosomal protein S18 acetylase RimI-like enzyme
MPGMAVEFLPFTRMDIPEALELWRATEGIGLFGDTPEVLAGCLDRNPGLSFVARDVGALIGTVLGTHDGRRGFVQHLAVAPSHRRRGIGGRLMTDCVAALERLGISRCHLFVQRGNDAGQGFWTRAGWRVRTDVVMMSRDLPRRD